MKNTYKIEIDEKSQYIVVNGKRMSIFTAADIFRVRMLNTMIAMKEGKLSKAIEVIVKEVIP